MFKQSINKEKQEHILLYGKKETNKKNRTETTLLYKVSALVLIKEIHKTYKPPSTLTTLW